MKSFSPSLINRQFDISDPDILVLLSDASRLLGELNAYGKLIPDVDFFIHMHVAKESTTSSMIEGTKTEINEAVMNKKDIVPEHIDDWLEVQSYTKAMTNEIYPNSHLNKFLLTRDGKGNICCLFSANKSHSRRNY